MKFARSVASQMIIGRYPVGPYRFIGPSIPAVLTSFTSELTWVFVDLWYYNASEFFFQGLTVDNFFGFNEWLEGTYTIASGVLPQRFVDGPGGAVNTVHWGTDRYGLPARLFMNFRAADVILTDTATLAATDGSSEFAIETWHNVAFTNGWHDSGGADVTCRYQKLPYGPNGTKWVALTGSMTGGTSNATPFTLPLGYRPSHKILPAVSSQQNPAAGADTPRFEINTTGVVNMVGCVGGANHIFFNIQFPTDA